MLDFNSIAADLLASADALLPQLLPAGRKRGHEYVGDGDTFASRRPLDRKILVGIKKAVDLRTPGAVPPPPAAVSEGLAAITPATVSDVDAELKALRDEYAEKVGKKPYHGWDAAALRDKIAAA